jgi:hypothetical protein
MYHEHDAAVYSEKLVTIHNKWRQTTGNLTHTAVTTSNLSAKPEDELLGGLDSRLLK